MGPRFVELLHVISESESIVDLQLDYIVGLDKILTDANVETLMKWFNNIERLSLRSNYLTDTFAKNFAEVNILHNLIFSGVDKEPKHTAIKFMGQPDRR